MRHSLDPGCDCARCDQARFEHRAVVVVLCGLVCACLAWMFLVGVAS